ncbi:MAG: putative 3-hydroxybutyryl-coa dehydrogenase oxidoreductase protein, partial [Pseudomonadota bacterium]
MSTLPFKQLGVVGCGVMGRGIVQIFAQSGVPVRLYDAQPQAVEAARESIAVVLAKLVEKGRLTASDADATLARITPVERLEALAECDLIIEAIIEQLEPKRALFAALEALVPAQTVLASNTSSLSVTAIAAGCRHP